MTADQNVATMRRAYNAFNTGDVGTLTELMDDTVWHLPGRSSMAGDYHGRAAGSRARAASERWSRDRPACRDLRQHLRQSEARGDASVREPRNRGHVLALAGQHKQRQPTRHAAAGQRELAAKCRLCVGAG